MILKSFFYEPRLNGFQNWIETFYEIVSHLETTCAYSGMMSNASREQGGRTAQYVLAENLTDEFELRYHDNYNTRFDDTDPSFVDCIQIFLIEKENENFKEVHKSPIPTEEDRFIMEYVCPECGSEWEMAGSCACNDHCPQCDAEITPTNVRDIE